MAGFSLSIKNRIVLCCYVNVDTKRKRIPVARSYIAVNDDDGNKSITFADLRNEGSESFENRRTAESFIGRETFCSIMAAIINGDDRRTERKNFRKYGTLIRYLSSPVNRINSRGEKLSPGFIKYASFSIRCLITRISSQPVD